MVRSAAPCSITQYQVNMCPATLLVHQGVLKKVFSLMQTGHVIQASLQGHSSTLQGWGCWPARLTYTAQVGLADIQKLAFGRQGAP
jgi:hypothetical protein